MTMQTHVARCALEFWRASGDRTESRLMALVDHFAATNGETERAAHHRESALANVKPWELKESVR